MKIVIAIISFMLLIFVAVILPIFIRVYFCKKCGRLDECHKMHKRGEVPPCMRNMPSSKTNFDI